jgi:cyclase
MSKKLDLIVLSFMSFTMVTIVCLAQFGQPLAVQRVQDNIYVVKGGSGANTGFYVGENEVVAIDAKMTTDAEKQTLQQMKNISTKPVTRIILTHSDADHVNGLNALPAGLKIYGHPQSKKDMEEAANTPNSQYLRDYLPNEACSPCTASRNPVQTVQVGSENIQLYFFGPAHTSGDLVVYFPAEKVAFVGDLAFSGSDPLIHRFKGGSSTGYLETLRRMMALDADTYVTGHTDPWTKNQLQDFYKAVSEKRDKVKAMVDEGKSLPEIKKAFGIEERTAKPGAMSFMSFVEVVYLDLTEPK